MSREVNSVGAEKGSLAAGRDATVSDLQNPSFLRNTTHYAPAGTRPQEMAIQALQEQLARKDEKIDNLDEEIRKLRREQEILREQQRGLNLVIAVTRAEFSFGDMTIEQFLAIVIRYLASSPKDFRSFIAGEVGRR